MHGSAFLGVFMAPGTGEVGFKPDGDRKRPPINIAFVAERMVDDFEVYVVDFLNVQEIKEL